MNRNNRSSSSSSSDRRSSIVLVVPQMCGLVFGSGTQVCHVCGVDGFCDAVWCALRRNGCARMVLATDSGLTVMGYEQLAHGGVVVCQQGCWHCKRGWVVQDGVAMLIGIWLTGYVRF